MNRRRLFQAVGIGAAAPVLAKLDTGEVTAAPAPTDTALVTGTFDDVLWLPDHTLTTAQRLPGMVTDLSISYDVDYGNRFLMESPYHPDLLMRPEHRLSFDIRVEAYERITKGELLAIISKGLERYPTTVW